jgi:peptide/nickel transport system substrate-binding protein
LIVLARLPSASGYRVLPRRAAFALLSIGLLLAGCAGPASPPSLSTGGERPAEAPKSTGPKTVRLGMQNEPVGGIALFGASGTGGPEPTFAFHAGLTIYDAKGILQPQLAQKVPTLDDGDWKTFPDGKMEVTWKLKPNLFWHDGTPLKAEDFVFGMRVIQDDQMPLSRGRWVRLISDVTAPDPQTLVVTWRSPYMLANASGPTDIAAVPTHILEPVYQAGDKQLFINHAYWSREFVGVGPYKISNWELGSHIEGQAFDQYVMGRPKIDRIIIRYFTDLNTMVANLMSGDLDVIPMGSLKSEQVQAIRQAWGPGGGVAEPTMSGIRQLQLQYRDPTLPWATDVRIRRALVHALDRPTMVDALQYGLTSPADTLATKEERTFQLMEQKGFGKYPYDLNAVQRLMNEAGWTKGADGTYQKDGRPFTVEARATGGSPDNIREGLAIADGWKAAGLGGTSFIIPDDATDKDELKARMQGGLAWPLTYTPDALEYFITPQIATESNRWRGRNSGGYSNAIFDDTYDRYVNTLNEGQRQQTLADLLKMAADEVIFIPLYYNFGTATTAVRKGVRGPAPTSPVQLVTAWNIQTWEMD